MAEAPYDGKGSEVRVNHLRKKEVVFMWLLSVLITLLFYFILKAFRTANLIPSTISVATSFLAVYLTFRRSAFYAVGYAANDLVLIVLWILAAMENRSYLAVVICFIIFFINDVYGVVSWRRMKERQKNPAGKTSGRPAKSQK